MVTGVDPGHTDRGDRIRARHVLEALARRCDVDLVLVGPTPDQEGMAALRGLVARVTVLQLSAFDHGLGALRAATAGRPWNMLYSQELRARVEATQAEYDAVMAFQLKVAPLAARVPTAMRMLELTDSLSLYRSLLPRSERRSRLILTGIEREESKWISAYDMSFVSSARDKQAVLQHTPGTRIIVVENGTTAWAEPVRPGAKTSVLFVGNLHYPPNRSGIEEFVKRTWPFVYERTRLPLRIVGECPPAFARVLRRSGVECVGYLKDLREEYDRALALVNPVQYGTGTNSKVLEGWAAGLPVVTAPHGAAGLNCQRGEHLLIADSTQAWVDALSGLSESPDLWQRMSRAGVQLVSDRYNVRYLWDSALQDALDPGRLAHADRV